MTKRLVIRLKSSRKKTEVIERLEKENNKLKMRLGKLELANNRVRSLLIGRIGGKLAVIKV